MASGFRLQKGCAFFTFSCFLLLRFSSFCLAAKRIEPGKVIRDGDTIVSGDKKFALGFFSPPGTTKRYVGIWYNGIPSESESVIWVANRENPIGDKNGALTIINDGNLAVLDGENNVVWSTGVFVPSKKSYAVLSDTGDLVLRRADWNGNGNGNGLKSVLWESFSHPTDTFLPEMKVYLNSSVIEQKILTSWTNPSAPFPGKFSLGIDTQKPPQIVVWEGGKRRWRSGHWNGLEFLGVPSMRADYLYGFKLYNEGDGRRVYFTYTLPNTSDLVHFKIVWNGNEAKERWEESVGQWRTIQMQPSSICDLYNQCGKFARCDVSSSSICKCIKGFVPSDPSQWSVGDWSGGCSRRTELQCQRNNGSGLGKEGFLKVDNIKLPDFAEIVESAGSDSTCERKCQEDCSCTAYAFVSGIPCMIWRRDLVDMQQFGDGGSTLFIRVVRDEFAGDRTRNALIVIVSVAVALIFIVSLSVWYLFTRKAKLHAARRNCENRRPNQLASGEFFTDLSGSGEPPRGTTSALAFFSFSSMAAATNNFSHENKLGQGGFGLVYKGILPCGQEIAVKRLSRKSVQGVQEFTNELTLIAKLQHRNLVKLLGCCVEGGEKMLLYEFMPNKSLDSFLFDSSKRPELDWSKCFKIIEGVARGLLYLHRDSRLRIIHRDLKASNILLDEEMNPKISDFGMARIFGGNQNEANTNRVVGTYGYMAPEYAMEGLFSVKSDVYSFGVLLLEIISGRRNTSFRSGEHLGIIGYAWDLWDEGKPMNLMHPSLSDSCVPEEVLRCIHLALLCVQDLAVHRPNMSSVVLFLETDNLTLPLPRPPTYTSMRRVCETEVWNQTGDIPSFNNITIRKTTVIRSH
ncbi:PREDICTED: G-type lectin S-receptor-like serine/threonine-protein kinase B120 [Ipomoea nil]|uniref:G-type lectin S-receptor-like serine/threonine-protein kinase B120 n=1 Tax=Ipomoea nil TaxID=35883 RepID=UPI000900BA82|nr:PREDICTED: G-type lectin S-receptor-like serine/threonine-protein kinase B120 [Ipomoea nil]